MSRTRSVAHFRRRQREARRGATAATPRRPRPQRSSPAPGKSGSRRGRARRDVHAVAVISIGVAVRREVAERVRSRRGRASPARQQRAATSRLTCVPPGEGDQTSEKCGLARVRARNEVPPPRGRPRQRSAIPRWKNFAASRVPSRSARSEKGAARRRSGRCGRAPRRGRRPPRRSAAHGGLAAHARARRGAAARGRRRGARSRGRCGRRSRAGVARSHRRGRAPGGPSGRPADGEQVAERADELRQRHRRRPRAAGQRARVPG